MSPYLVEFLTLRLYVGSFHYNKGIILKVFRLQSFVVVVQYQKFEVVSTHLCPYYIIEILNTYNDSVN